RGDRVASFVLGPDWEIIRANPDITGNWFNKPGDAEPLVSVLPIVKPRAEKPRCDVLLHTREKIYIYANPGKGNARGRFPCLDMPCRDDSFNFTLY
ncbi:MAG: hypothetical protein Q6373_017610, partial [Candidatus Sigynarchaeota archaeon]